MSKTPGKFIIGLTGNIATGKSVVRKMLEHLGAYSIDADSLSHRAIAPGAPGHKPVVETFGKWVLNEDGSIDRGKLGKLVFNDPAALGQLEAIVHPLVGQAVDLMVKRASQRVVVVEAIKLLESSLREQVDAIWVVYAPEEIQVERLMRKRGMSRAEALGRIHAQGPQDAKIAAAKVVIRNLGSYEELWKQVSLAWKEISPAADTSPQIMKPAGKGDFAVQRGRPRDSQAIAELITRLSKGQKRMDSDDVMAAFGDRAFLLLQRGKELVGLVGWQVENLVARTTDLYLNPGLPLDQGLPALITEVERASQDLQCEASLLFLSPELAGMEEVWKQLGYEKRSGQSLGVQAWSDAAAESMPPGTTLYFKQLRVDRILRPI